MKGITNLYQGPLITVNFWNIFTKFASIPNKCWKRSTSIVVLELYANIHFIKIQNFLWCCFILMRKFQCITCVLNIVNRVTLRILYLAKRLSSELFAWLWINRTTYQHERRPHSETYLRKFCIREWDQSLIYAKIKFTRTFPDYYCWNSILWRNLHERNVKSMS